MISRRTRNGGPGVSLSRLALAWPGHEPEHIIEIRVWLANNQSVQDVSRAKYKTVSSVIMEDLHVKSLLEYENDHMVSGIKV